jgi:CheY-like chemotaxis protein
MAKILVVDDEPDLEILIKQKFRKQIRANEYQFVFASNGKEALVSLETMKDVDIVLSDINMPETPPL